jgi:hypothetical protein
MICVNGEVMGMAFAEDDEDTETGDEEDYEEESDEED